LYTGRFTASPIPLPRQISPYFATIKSSSLLSFALAAIFQIEIELLGASPFFPLQVFHTFILPLPFLFLLPSSLDGTEWL
jgi:hypothetical protein